MKNFNYYEDQIKNLKPSDEYKFNIVISDSEGNKTKTLSVNLESIPQLINFLEVEKNRLEKLEGK